MTSPFSVGSYVQEASRRRARANQRTVTFHVPLSSRKVLHTVLSGRSPGWFATATSTALPSGRAERPRRPRRTYDERAASMTRAISPSTGPEKRSTLVMGTPAAAAIDAADSPARRRDWISLGVRSEAAGRSDPGWGRSPRTAASSRSSKAIR